MRIYKEITMATLFRRTIRWPFLVLAGISFSACERKPAPLPPKIEVFSGEVKLSGNRDNLYLSYQFDYKIRHIDGLTWRYFKVVNGEEQFVNGSGGSSGMMTVPALADTFVSGGEKDLLLEIRKSISGYESWNAQLEEGEQFTFLNYTGATGKEVSYGVRLEADTEDSYYQRRLSSLETRVRNLESDPILSKTGKEKIDQQFEEGQLKSDVNNLIRHQYGFTRGIGKLVIQDEALGEVELEDWHLRFSFWRKEDREKSRFDVVTRTNHLGEFEFKAPPGDYDEIQFGGTIGQPSSTRGFTYSLRGYPVLDVSISKDETVRLPPIELVRRPEEGR